LSIKNAYNSWSKIYDTNANKTRDLDKKITKEILAKYSYKTVMELGCGTGKNTVYLAENAKEITAIDFSEKMLAIAKRKLNKFNVKFIQADLNKKWEIPDQSADLVTCSLTLEHINNIDALFKQTYNKLKDKGKFFISELHPFKQYIGSKARYESETGIVELEVYLHHTTDYLNAAYNSGFKLLELNEWFDDDNQKDIPRLISFVLEK